MLEDAVVVIDLAKDPCPIPRNYGVIDFNHNKYGQVSSAWIYDSRDLKETNPLALESREEQRWRQDNEEHMVDYYREGWMENERIAMRRNYAYFCGGWDCDEDYKCTG